MVQVIDYLLGNPCEILSHSHYLGDGSWPHGGTTGRMRNPRLARPADQKVSRKTAIGLNCCGHKG